MTKNILFFLIIGTLFLLTLPFQSCQNRNEDVKHDTIIVHDTIIKYDTVIKHDTVFKKPPVVKPIIPVHHIVAPKKPNIYIYPEKKTSLKVTVLFPKGGSVVKSDPLYGNGWSVTVEPGGKIDKKYDYLFYECTNPDEWQYKTGWIIEKEKLMGFFQTNLAEYGFNTIEIKDFTDYWIPRFDKYKYYLIYPQEKEIIDNLVVIDYSVKPDNILRLFYAVKGTNEKIEIEQHTVKPGFKRTGFYVTEWGVII